MERPLSAYARVGTIAFMSYPTLTHGTAPDIEAILSRLAADPYFSAIEVNWIRDPEVRRRMAAKFSQAGMTVCYGAQPRLLTTGLNPNSLEESVRQAALASLKEGVDEAIELGAAGLAFLSGPYDPAAWEDAYQALLATTRELCSYAAARGGLRIELEVFDYDVDKKSLIGPTEAALRFAKDMRATHDNFGLVIDLSHFPLIRETVEQSVYPVREYITHVHIGNAVVEPGLPAYGDQHPRFGFPHSANGEAELVEFLRALLDIGYLNEKEPPVLSFEVKPFGEEDPEMVLAGCKRFLDAAWRKV